MSFITPLILFLGILGIPGAQASEPAKPAADPHAAPAEPEKPVKIGPQRKYTPGPVEKFPSEISGVDLKTGKTIKYSPKRGRATVVFFVASWCEPCQQLMPQVKNLAKKYENIYTDIIYVFAHDTKDDASGFAREHKLTGHMVLANHEILKAFKNPPLPAFYVGDRYNYLSNRALKLTSSDLAKLDDYLTKLTAL